MKASDIKEGMKVGFTHDGVKHIGVVRELYVIKESSIPAAIVETPDQMVNVRVSRLLGLLG